LKNWKKKRWHWENRELVPKRHAAFVHYSYLKQMPWFYVYIFVCFSCFCFPLCASTCEVRGSFCWSVCLRETNSVPEASVPMCIPLPVLSSAFSC
jgi:hypothetical protein